MAAAAAHGSDGGEGGGGGVSAEAIGQNLAMIMSQLMARLRPPPILLCSPSCAPCPIPYIPKIIFFTPCCAILFTATVARDLLYARAHLTRFSITAPANVQFQLRLSTLKMELLYGQGSSHSQYCVLEYN